MKEGRGILNDIWSRWLRSFKWCFITAMMSLLCQFEANKNSLKEYWNTALSLLCYYRIINPIFTIGQRGTGANSLNLLHILKTFPSQFIFLILDFALWYTVPDSGGVEREKHLDWYLSDAFPFSSLTAMAWVAEKLCSLTVPNGTCKEHVLSFFSDYTWATHYVE